MTKTRSLIGALVAFAIVALGASACGTTATTSDTADTESTAETSESESGGDTPTADSTEDDSADDSDTTDDSDASASADAEDTADDTTDADDTDDAADSGTDDGTDDDAGDDTADGTDGDDDDAAPVCGLTEDFSSATALDDCWTPGVDNTGNLTAEIADGAAIFSIPAETATAATDETGTLNIKDVGYTKTVDSTDFDLTGVFTSVSGLVDAFTASTVDGIFLRAKSAAGGSTVICGLVGTDLGAGSSGISVLFYETSGANDATQSAPFGSGTGGGPVTVRLTKTDSSIRCEFSTDGGGAFTTVGTPLDLADFADQASTEAGILLIHTGEETLIAETDDLSFTVTP